MTEFTKNVSFLWNEKAEEAINTLKNYYCGLRVTDFSYKVPEIVNTETSTYAIGAVLEQERSSGIFLVAFTSVTLHSAEQNYAPHKLELLAIFDKMRA